MKDALLRLASLGLTLAVVAIVLASSVVAVHAAITRRSARIRRALFVVVGALLSQGAALASGLLLAPARTLALGAELPMCDIDCDLLVSADRVARDGDEVDVTLRLRSDAREAAMRPGALRLRLLDAAGHRYAPVQSQSGMPLGPGEARRETLRFTVPAGEVPQRLEATWGGVLDYLVPGPEHPLVKRRTALDLQPPAHS